MELCDARMVSVQVKINAEYEKMKETNNFVRRGKVLFSNKVAFKILKARKRRKGDWGFFDTARSIQTILNFLNKHLRMRRNDLQPWRPWLKV